MYLYQIMVEGVEVERQCTTKSTVSLAFAWKPIMRSNKYFYEFPSIFERNVDTICAIRSIRNYHLIDSHWLDKSAWNIIRA